MWQDEALTVDSGCYTASDGGTRLPGGGHCQDAVSQLHGRLSLGTGVCTADVQVQDPRVHVPHRVHVGYHGQQRIHCTRL